MWKSEEHRAYFVITQVSGEHTAIRNINISATNILHILT